MKCVEVYLFKSYNHTNWNTSCSPHSSSADLSKSISFVLLLIFRFCFGLCIIANTIRISKTTFGISSCLSKTLLNCNVSTPVSEKASCCLRKTRVLICNVVTFLCIYEFERISSEASCCLRKTHGLICKVVTFLLRRLIKLGRFGIADSHNCTEGEIFHEGFHFVNLFFLIYI